MNTGRFEFPDTTRSKWVRNVMGGGKAIDERIEYWEEKGWQILTITPLNSDGHTRQLLLAYTEQVEGAFSDA